MTVGGVLRRHPSGTGRGDRRRRHAMRTPGICAFGPGHVWLSVTAHGRSPVESPKCPVTQRKVPAAKRRDPATSRRRSRFKAQRSCYKPSWPRSEAHGSRYKMKRSAHFSRFGDGLNLRKSCSIKHLRHSRSGTGLFQLPVVQLREDDCATDPLGRESSAGRSTAPVSRPLRRVRCCQTHHHPDRLLRVMGPRAPQRA